MDWNESAAAWLNPAFQNHVVVFFNFLFSLSTTRVCNLLLQLQKSNQKNLNVCNYFVFCLFILLKWCPVFWVIIRERNVTKDLGNFKINWQKNLINIYIFYLDVIGCKKNLYLWSSLSFFFLVITVENWSVTQVSGCFWSTVIVCRVHFLLELFQVLNFSLHSSRERSVKFGDFKHFVSLKQ